MATAAIIGLVVVPNVVALSYAGYTIAHR